MTTETVSAPPGEDVAIATLHAGDVVLIADHGTFLIVVLRRVLHGSTGTTSLDHGCNFALCDWQAETDPAERGTACFGDGDQVTRLHEGLAAA
jgi:hypothetical protein